MNYLKGLKMKHQCKLCGFITQNEYLCDNCQKDMKNKTFREFLQEEDHLINFLIKDCMNCPLKYTEDCDMLYSNPQSQQEELFLCKQFIKKWLDKNKY